MGIIPESIEERALVFQLVNGGKSEDSDYILVLEKRIEEQTIIIGQLRDGYREKDLIIEEQRASIEFLKGENITLRGLLLNIKTVIGRVL